MIIDTERFALYDLECEESDVLREAMIIVEMQERQLRSKRT